MVQQTVDADLVSLHIPGLKATKNLQGWIFFFQALDSSAEFGDVVSRGRCKGVLLVEELRSFFQSKRRERENIDINTWWQCRTCSVVVAAFPPFAPLRADTMNTTRRRSCP